VFFNGFSRRDSVEFNAAKKRDSAPKLLPAAAHFSRLGRHLRT